jgi:hypothetical protein
MVITGSNLPAGTKVASTYITGATTDQSQLLHLVVAQVLIRFLMLVLTYRIIHSK